jgi:hypothetical protein
MAATNVQAFSGDVEITSNLEVGTANLFVDTLTSNVGIGTTIPGSKLAVESTGNTSLRITSGSGSNSTLEFGDTDDHDTGRIDYNNNINQMGFYTNGSERMRIDSAGNTTIGPYVASPRFLLDIPAYYSPDQLGLVIHGGNGTNTGTYEGVCGIGFNSWYNKQNVKTGIINEPASWGRGNMHFCTVNTVGSGSTSDRISLSHSRMVLTTGGSIGINETSPAALMHFKSTSEYSANSGIRLERNVYSWYWEIHTWGEDLYFSFNGTMRVWIDRGGGTGIKLNFTGQHRTFVEDLLYSDAEPKKGLIVSADKNQYIKMSGGVEAGSNAITINESLPIVSLSNVANDKTCFGVISDAEDPDQRIVELGHIKSLDSKEDGDTRIFINSVGEGAIWVTDINGSLESGDYITTSNIAGYGMKQDDDILHNYTVAKITMDCDFNPSTQPVKRLVKELRDVQYWIKTTYSDTSYENYSNLSPENQYIKLETYYLSENDEISAETYENLTSEQKTKYTEMTRTTYQCVSTVEYKTDPGPDVENVTTEVRQEYVNVLDENGQIMWEEHPTETEKAYKIRYLDAGGVESNEANHVHKAAFVGCTYHCG